MLRLLDEVTKQLLSGFVVERGGQYVSVSRVVYSTPERAFSDSDKRIDLPVISFFRFSQEFSQEANNLAVQEVGGIIKDKATYTGRRYKLVPVSASYQVDFWVKFTDDLQILQTQLLHYFRPVKRYYLEIDTGVGAPLDYSLSGMTDNSDLEPGEEERVLRFTTDLEVKGYLPLETVDVKLVKDVVMHIDVL